MNFTLHNPDTSPSLMAVAGDTNKSCLDDGHGALSNVELLSSSAGVNFINILQAAFALEDAKSVKRY
jgi:hypothetical protein